MKLNKHKKRLELKYILLIGIVSIAIIIGFISVMSRDDRELSFIEKGIKDIGLGIQKTLYIPIRFVTDRINNYSEMKRIYREYKNIDLKAAKASLFETENMELKKSLDELKEALELNHLVTDYKLLNATVIHRDLGNWYNIITLDKGEKDGVKKNMVVINSKGLIGKVIKTTYFTCDVKLITTSDLNNKISVGIISDDNITYGLLSGYDYNNKQLLVTDIVDNTTIKVGDKVITSGLSDIFPKGLIVGLVSKVESNEFGISKTVKVTSDIDFNNLSYLSIVVVGD